MTDYEPNFCEDCATWYVGNTHACTNHRPAAGDISALPYYQKRREFLTRQRAWKERWSEGDNDPASPEQAWA